MIRENLANVPTVGTGLSQSNVRQAIQTATLVLAYGAREPAKTTKKNLLSLGALTCTRFAHRTGAGAVWQIVPAQVLRASRFPVLKVIQVSSLRKP